MSVPEMAGPVLIVCAFTTAMFSAPTAIPAGVDVALAGVALSCLQDCAVTRSNALNRAGPTFTMRAVMALYSPLHRRPDRRLVVPVVVVVVVAVEHRKHRHHPAAAAGRARARALRARRRGRAPPSPDSPAPARRAA